MNGEPTNNLYKDCSFWPQLLVAMSVMLFLGWQLTAALQQRQSLRHLVDQQSVLVNQAAQVEGAFKAMMTDLVSLSSSDADARAIVAKYRISFNPNAQVGSPVGNKSDRVVNPPSK